MKLVTFAQDVAPHSKGDTRLVPDEVAAALEQAGEISSAVSWPLDNRIGRRDTRKVR